MRMLGSQVPTINFDSNQITTIAESGKNGSVECNMDGETDYQLDNETPFRPG